jgi:CRISPR-associated endonuclease/helicase Cas3
MLAHINHVDGREQTLAQHSDNVSKLASSYAGTLGLSSTAELIGLVHDMGKGTAEFQDYITQNDVSKRGRINHASWGGRCIMERFSSGDGTSCTLLSEIVSAVTVSHHQGIVDILSVGGEDNLKKKLYPGKGKYYSEALENFPFPMDRVDELYKKASAEIAALNEKISSLAVQIADESQVDDGKKKKKVRLRAKHFMLGLVTRFLLSTLLDADRYDTACFMAGDEPEFPASSQKLWEHSVQKLDCMLDSLVPKNSIDAARADISRACRDAADNTCGVFQLSVPTGAGKTFSGLRFALHSAKKIQQRPYILHCTL